MFDEFIRRLQALNGMEIPVEDTLEDESYYARLCPSDQCQSTFKVLWEDWKEKVPDEAAYCPYCRHVAPASAFNTAEQDEHFAALALPAIVNHLNGHSVSMLSMPPVVEEAMTLRILCEQCGCHFVVIGAGYFCPACGHNSAGETFNQSVERARNAVNSLPAIKAALTDKDASAQIAQNLIENTLGNLVAAFQYFAEAMYPRLPMPAAKPRRNAFQSLTEGSKLWESADGTAYSTLLDAAEMADLVRLFQQRHVLQHSEGIVDQEYIDRSGDTTYAVGQRLIVREQSVLRLADLVSKLTDGMRANTV